MIVRVVTIVAAGLLLAGCSTEEGMRAQELLQQAETAQAALTSSTFDGSMAISVEGMMNVRMLFNGATAPEGEWVSLRTTGVPDGGDIALQVLVRGGRAWTNIGGRWQSGPAPAGAGSSATMSAEAFQQLAQYVKDVRVTEHQLIGGKLSTTIAGDIDTEGMIKAFAKLGSFAQGSSLDLSELGLDIGDIHAVLTIDEKTRLLDTAYITFAMSAEGKHAEIELRYRLATANEPVRLPRAPG
ncbi:MAG: hypothetical protein ACRDNB_05360 [Gaiellaceae bacterium]